MKRFLLGPLVAFLLIYLNIIAIAEENVIGAEAKGVNWFPIILAVLAVILMLAKIGIEHHIRRDLQRLGFEETCWYEKKVNQENPQRLQIYCNRRKKIVGPPHKRCNHYSPNKDFLEFAHTHPLYHYVSTIDFLCTGLIAFATILVSL